MKGYKLSFGTINILEKNLAEVIVDEGIVMDEVLVDEYHDFLLSNLDKPILLLINKMHAYTYTFNGQIAFSKLEDIKARAVVNNTSAALMSTQTVMNINKAAYTNIKVFRDRETALSWLNSL